MHKGRDPLPLLASNNLDAEDLNQQYHLQAVKFDQADERTVKEASRLFPESHADVIKRCKDNFERQKSDIADQKVELQAEITVTHGLFIDEIQTLASGQALKEWCNYCAITAYKMTQDRIGNEVKVEIRLAADDSHVVTKANV